MKILAHYELEGLVRQGQHSVWVPLGCFESLEAAKRALSGGAVRRSRWGSQIESSRVTPLFRDPSGGYSLSYHAAHESQAHLRPHFLQQPATSQEVASQEVASLPA